MGLDFLGFLRPIRGFSMGYRQSKSKNSTPKMEPAGLRMDGPGGAPFPGVDSIFSSLCGAISGTPVLAILFRPSLSLRGESPGRGDFKDRAGERQERFRKAREGRKTPSKSFLSLPFSAPNPTPSRGCPRSRLINFFLAPSSRPNRRSRRPSLAGGRVGVRTKIERILRPVEKFVERLGSTLPGDSHSA